MITKPVNYGPCENLHAVAPEDVPPATYEVIRDVSSGIVTSFLVCSDCAARFEMQGWTAEPLRSTEEEDMPYREEWEALYGTLSEQESPLIDPESFNPFS